MRKPIVAGNWKMNKTIPEAVELVRGLRELVRDVEGADVVVCPPFTALPAVWEELKGTNIKLGAQNMFWEPKGAFTGEISAEMLLTAGCEYVILGHSERRQYFGETNEVVNRKVKAALESGLKPIVCVGETREERERGVTEEVVRDHVMGSLSGLTAEDLGKGLVVAYEPVWAIGTGLTATPEQAQEVHALIRKLIAEGFGEEASRSLRIQYGGSIKPGNARELFSQPDIDGGLVGGASLEAESFASIVKSAL